MAKEADIFGHLKMFIRGRLKVAGIAGDLVAIESFITKVNLVLETYFLCVLYLLLREVFAIVTARLEASAILNYRAYG
ncbi:hypothetical protein QQ73_18340 [Candidatus Endoriftia persephone str. Guaymas]|nr:hypothetical protein [Candidatus Endoriftia persephone str. Guaymas]